MVIIALHRVAEMLTVSLRAAAACGPAEQLLEEATALGVVRLAAGKLEAGIPLRQRAEIGAFRRIAARADRLVVEPLGRVRQHGIGLIQGHHPLVGVGGLADIRMMLAGEFAAGLLDVVGLGGQWRAQRLV